MRWISYALYGRDANKPNSVMAAVGAMDAEQAKAMVASYVGREVRVFVRPAALEVPSQPLSQQDEAEPDDFYNFTADDYARVMANKKEERFLKPKKFREAEIAARRARITRATVRVQFPDNVVLEADFNSSDPVSELTQLLKKVLLRPELRFYLYTTPPKQKITNFQATMYEAGLAPGGLVYFSYERDGAEGPYLKEDVAALQGLEETPSSKPPLSSDSNPENSSPRVEPPAASESLSRPAAKATSGKPKWLRLSK